MTPQTPVSPSCETPESPTIGPQPHTPPAGLQALRAKDPRNKPLPRSPTRSPQHKRQSARMSASYTYIHNHVVHTPKAFNPPVGLSHTLDVPRPQGRRNSLLPPAPENMKASQRASRRLSASPSVHSAMPQPDFYVWLTDDEADREPPMEPPFSRPVSPCPTPPQMAAGSSQPGRRVSPGRGSSRPQTPMMFSSIIGPSGNQSLENNALPEAAHEQREERHEFVRYLNPHANSTTTLLMMDSRRSPRQPREARDARDDRLLTKKLRSLLAGFRRGGRLKESAETSKCGPPPSRPHRSPSAQSFEASSHHNHHRGSPPCVIVPLTPPTTPMDDSFAIPNGAAAAAARYRSSSRRAPPSDLFSHFSDSSDGSSSDTTRERGTAFSSAFSSKRTSADSKASRKSSELVGQNRGWGSALERSQSPGPATSLQRVKEWSQRSASTPELLKSLRVRKESGHLDG